MPQEFAQPDQSIFTLVSGHLVNPGGVGFTKGVRGEVGDVQPVLVLVRFEHHIEPVRCVGLLPLGDEYQVLRALGVHLLIAFLYVPFERRVDFDYPSLSRLLLKENEGISGKKVVPGQEKNITDAETEVDAAADQERNGEVPVLIKPVHKGNRLVPFKGFCGRITAFFAHQSYDF